MRNRHVAKSALTYATAIAGCGGTRVDADASGCSADDAKRMNKDSPRGLAGVTGADKWRCKDHALQAARR